MKLNKKSGAVLAATATAFLMSGAAMAPASAATDGNVHCYGVTVCKGNSACKTATDACKGKNACKGHGFVSVSTDACKAIGGRETEMAKKKG